ncbi:hypothetical protein [Streptomyces sp. URMC 123]|uniref:hypothetical protein n=1 Tax=Streptomyces sp. URMC 123 TaxID=3423403 RepID=UPI003F1C1003
MVSVSEPVRPARRGRLLRITAACAVLLALAGYLVVHLVTGGSGPPRCTVRAGGGDGGTYELQPEQAVNAATIEAVGSAKGLPERAITIALATAMQESGLRNIDYGDRDSLGLFQQRPSQGWGDRTQIMDPVYSAGKFYDHLVRVPGYSRLPLTVAAQKVQRSGYPQAYAKHEPNAALLSSALTGRVPASFTCTTGGDDGTPGDPVRVREKLARDFGPDVLPRPAAAAGAQSSPSPSPTARTESGGPDSGGSAGSTAGGDRQASATSPAPSVITIPVGTAAARAGGEPGARGWELAHWAVAHAAELRIAEVSYAGRVWTAEESQRGWRTADGNAAGSGAAGAGDVRITTAR